MKPVVHRIICALVLFAPAFVAAGCSAILGANFDHGAAGDDAGDESADGNGNMNMNANGNGNGASRGDDTASSGMSSVDAAGATQAGSLYFAAGNAVTPWYVIADFAPYDPDVQNELAAYENCVAMSTVGPCVVSACGPTNLSALPVSSGTAPKLGAGAIEISGATAPIVLYDNGDAGYTPISSDAGLWSSGATVDVRGTGADFPAFEEKVQLASSLQMSKPTATLIAGHLTYVQSRASDLTFAWSPGGDGTLTLTFKGDYVDDDAGYPEYAATQVSCTYPVGSKTGTVPHALWSHFTSPDIDVSVRNEVLFTSRIDTSILQIDSLGTVDPAIAGGYIGYALAVTLR